MQRRSVRAIAVVDVVVVVDVFETREGRGIPSYDHVHDHDHVHDGRVRMSGVGLDMGRA
jgi:hypothetical protein